MLDHIRQQIPNYATDIKLNLSLVLDAETSDLSQQQLDAIALASAYATKQTAVIEMFEQIAQERLDETYIHAAKSAASIMAMNNIYYRFAHLVSDNDIKKLPAKLRMNVIGKPGIEKIDFELMSLAISAINGCGMCMDAHTKTLQKSGVSNAAIQQTVRIAAVINACSQAFHINQRS